MQISSISANKATFNANSNHSQKKVGFSSVNVHEVMPEFTNLIQHGINGATTVYPVIKRLPPAIQDNIRANRIVSLTGSEVLEYRQKGGDMNAFSTILREAEKNNTIANA